MNYKVYFTLVKKGAAVKKASNVGREAYLGFHVRECPHIPKILVMDQSHLL
jgi:hypothetical protein